MSTIIASSMKWLLPILVCTVGLAQAQDAQHLFASMCARCHGLDGRGGEHGPKIAGVGEGELYRVIRNGRPGAGMPAFGKTLTAEQIRALVRWLRRDEHAPGNGERGRALFGGCTGCHRAGGIGSELTAENRDDFEHPAIVTLTASDGQVWSGVVRNEDNFSIQLQTPDGAFHFMRRSAVKGVERQPAISEKDLDDVAAFVRQGARQAP